MIPEVFLIRQTPGCDHVGDPSAEADRQMDRCLAEAGLAAGDKVAIACGSRGIQDVDRIVKTVVARLREAGARPFIFPAMGCHGGGTGVGQKATLDHLGISEQRVGCPVLSEIEPDEISVTGDGVPVFMDRNARRADHLMVVNRVKPHSDFFGTIGSGLLKMLVIGCGKMRGADATHEAAIEHGLEHMLRSVAAEVLKTTPVLGGLGVIEGPTGGTESIHWVPSKDMLTTEPSLFRRACELAPAIPIPRVNLLVVDWTGKNISGCGMDPFVIGRQEYLNVHDSYTDFRADRVYVRDLTPESLGNADGIGMADATSQKLVTKLDHEAIRIGVMTSRTLPLGRIPIAFPSDREAIEGLLGTTSARREDATLVRVRNTTELEYLEVSENLLDWVEGREDLRIVKGPYALGFDEQGELRAIAGVG